MESVGDWLTVTATADPRAGRVLVLCGGCGRERADMAINGPPLPFLDPCPDPACGRRDCVLRLGTTVTAPVLGVVRFGVP